MLQRVATVASIALGLADAARAEAAGGVAPTAEAAAHRPRVCLVLSGGGARGAAHIGVLRVLEELRVPVDCVTGTSMGAVVGSAYATGLTIEEMEALLGKLTVDALFQERPPREERTIRRRQEESRNLFGPLIGITDDGGVVFPKGVFSGIRLETILRDIARVRGPVEFDTLPIPFRAVATDLVTGKPVVFERGELAQVTRASMSVPGAISPAEVGGMLLVDGGLVNNLPVDVARSLGADIVIAVNVGTPLARREAITDVLGVTAQMIAILTEQNVQATLATLRPTDILIEPALGDFSAGDFDRLRETVPIGEAAARKVADRLAALAVPPDRYAAWNVMRTLPPTVDRRPVDEIRFETLRRVNPEYAESLLTTRPGQPIDQAALDADLLRLYGTDDFEHVGYRLIDSPQRRILNVEAVEKSWGPNYARLGLGLSSDFSGHAYFDVLGQYRRSWLDRAGSEWRTDIALGRNSSLVTEYYRPLDARHRFFVAPEIELQRYYLDVFVGDESVAEYAFPTFLAAVDAGMNVGRYGELRVGLFGGVTRADLNDGVPVFPDAGTTRLAGIRARGYVDQLDSATFPKSGYAGGFSVLKGLKALGSEVSYDRWDVNVFVSGTSGPHTGHLGVRASGPFTSGQGANFTSQPWGGFLQQSGFRTGQILTERFVFARASYIYKLRHVPLLEGLYAGLSAEVGDYHRPLVPGNPSGVLYSGAAFLALDSPLGPVYLGYGVGSGSNRSAYFFLGRP
jgi:NTE family protein